MGVSPGAHLTDEDHETHRLIIGRANMTQC